MADNGAMIQQLTKVKCEQCGCNWTSNYVNSEGICFVCEDANEYQDDNVITDDFALSAKLTGK
jgi:hypothetical protein